jgi:hypothetical protein
MREEVGGSPRGAYDWPSPSLVSPVSQLPSY